MDKPTVFIGSSTEGLEPARAIRRLLNNDAKIILWNEGFFKLGNAYLEQLVDSLGDFDFAIFVATPDDYTESREVHSSSPRDNVIFELGLFMGHLGRKRTFLVYQSGGNIKVPTDFAGITTADYHWPHTAEQTKTISNLSHEYMVSLGTACDNIRERIDALGLSETKVARKMEEIKTRQNSAESRIGEAEKRIERLFAYTMSDAMYLNLKKLARGRFGHFRNNGSLSRELRHLRDIGYIKSHGYIGDLPPEGDDLSVYIEVTAAGKQFVEFRESLSSD